MKRGELYRVRRPKSEPKRARVFVVVSRPGLIESNFSTVICAPVYTRRHGLPTEVPVGQAEGLKHDSSVACDALVSIPKSVLTDYLGTIALERLPELDQALRVALVLD